MEPIDAQFVVVRPARLKWWQGWRFEYDYSVIVPTLIIGLSQIGRLL